MITRDKIVNIAKKQIGIKSGDKFRSWYNKNVCNIGNYHWAWCAASLSWCAAQAGLTNAQFLRTASSSTMLNSFKQRGQFKKRGNYIPRPGDIILFRYANATTPASHVGMVEYVSAGRVYTIEFNSGLSADGCVGRYSYNLNTSFIVGYGVYLIEQKIKLKSGTNLYKHSYKDPLGNTSKVLAKMKKGKKVIYIPNSDNGKGWSKIQVGSKIGWVMNKHLKKKHLSKFQTKTFKAEHKAIRVRKNNNTKKVIIKPKTKYVLICKIKQGKYKDYKYIGIGKKRYYVK